MKPLAIAFFILFCATRLLGQCNTTLNKLLPDQSVNNDDAFGDVLAATEDVLVIGARNSDTLGVLSAGIAYVYEKTAAGWAYRAMLKPSNPDEFGEFGTAVAVDPTGTTIVVVDQLLSHNRIYVFEKPAAGWETMTETVWMESPGYADLNLSVNISDDASKIVISNPWSGEARFFVYHKPATGWTNSIIPETFMGPDYGTNQNMYGIDILVKGDYIYVASDNDPTGDGIYVYKRSADSYTYLAKLSMSFETGAGGYFGRHLTATDDMIATTGDVYLEGGDSGVKIFVFKKNGEWQNANETIHFELPDDINTRSIFFPLQIISPTEIAAACLQADGEWHTGKVYLARTLDGTWNDVATEVIFEEEELTSRASFAHELVWNGTELIRSKSLLPVGAASRDAVVSLRRSGGIWGSLQHITIARKNSANFLYGSSVHKSDETLFAGAPYDGTAGEEAGAVYVYEKSGDAYTHIHTIVPSARKLRANGTRDSGFGYSVFSFGEELAIGAPSYRDGERLGKIFLYKRSGTSWDNPTLYDSIAPPEELMLDHFGAYVQMDGNFLFASAYNNFNDEHTNAVVVFEKQNEKWIYKELLKPGRPLDKSWPSVRFSLLGDYLLVGAYFSFDGGVYMYQRGSTGKWEVLVQQFNGDVFSSVGSDVKLLENHFFVGVPAYDYGGLDKSGAVNVYAKLPGEEWRPGMQAVATIGARTPVKGGNFGASIDAIGNTLVVGAPGSVFSESNQIRTIPGNTYIIQAKSYYWDKRIEFLNLQGDRYSESERDHFGSDVGVDEQTFFIGAKNENTTAGPFSGAVYYVPTPPVVFLVPPICGSAGSVQLKGYPFNGTWSGPGVTDPSGTFDPSVVGGGIYELSYTTPNCAFVGSIQVEVQNGPAIERVSAAEVALCSEDGVELAVTNVQGAIYEWFFKPLGTQGFGPIGGGGHTKMVTNPGEYFASVRGAQCLSASPTFSVIIEAMDVVIGPQPVVCNHGEAVLLSVSVEGTWEGIGVRGDSFVSDQLVNSKYPLTFRFTSPKGCPIALKDSIEVRVIEPIVLQRGTDDFCESGSATLKAEPSDDSLAFTWFYGEVVGQQTEILKPLDGEAVVYESGYYHLSATNGDCIVYSDTVEVGFNTDLAMELAPKEKEVVFCAIDENFIEAHARNGTIFSWYFKPFDESPFELIRGGTDSKLEATKSGYYKVEAEYGFCSFESELTIEVKTDSLWAPNIITPNGDGLNDAFEVLTNADTYTLSVFNRYGVPIYTAVDDNWDGGSAVSGVYFWQVRYPGCGDVERAAKGWVQVVR